MRITSVLVFLILLLSCNESVEPNNGIVYEKTEVSVKPKLSLLDEDINVQDIKRQVGRNVTTSFLGKKSVSIYPDRGKNNYYGAYYFTSDNETDRDVIGSLVVYDSVNPYVYDKLTDEFVEVCLFEKGISLYNNKVSVGMPVKNVIELMGDNYTKLGDSLLCYNQTDKKAFFKIKDSLVASVRIGVYREGIAIDSVINKKQVY
ncbi:hypothetical protein GN157_06600 [Flavobacterium rakeshii]|uniref:Uncharacterized protein n=1 Tax=Flavobacterium rakeshii TaxID=1038845 RepID=A0A6N8HDC7_9FLAO|nr:hypothetical protein [Flavobacterium rakeshii]MEE1897990.1 hypothetical protein [Flavobacterium rakeshii]MUV03376.1 hypothetical protein [Flavobacterium rakeshii]